MSECGGDELAEERVRFRGLGLEFRMELHGEEPRMVGQLDDLDEIAVGTQSAGDEALGLERFAIFVVELVAMPVPFVDRFLTVRTAARGFRARARQGHDPSRIVPPRWRTCV